MVPLNSSCAQLAVNPTSGGSFRINSVPSFRRVSIRKDIRAAVADDIKKVMV